MKFWSCCHLWRTPDKVVPCRFDWHQTGSQAIFSIYAKNSLPELSYAESNSTTVHAKHRPLCALLGSLRSSASLWRLITWAHLDLPSPTDTHTERGKENGKWNA
uniref:Uncharacterized protein n=1 Tax=Oncorhynchus tshawytscha TaxID=74940 RepID=A0AAZ3PQJ4_ONCTS